MIITNRPFGVTKAKEKATLYIIQNDQGMEVSISDYGAIITSIKVPAKDGKKYDVVLGYDTLSSYEVNGPHFGAFIGRNGNRIKDAKVVIDGKTYELEKNNGVNNLHSGSCGYDKKMHSVEIFQDKDEISIELSRLSPDMEQGFPGNLDYTVTYTLTNENELVIEYYAVSDKDTVVNMTNHSYFNLNGCTSGSIEGHQVMIDADAFTPSDASLIPTGEICDVTGTPMDFRKMKAIGTDINTDYEALNLGHGYDHNYVLKTTPGEDAVCVAEAVGDKTGIHMEVYTDLPGMQFYTGNFLSDEETGKQNFKYNKRYGVCFETQYFPNSCNEKKFLSCIKKAGQPYETVTIYRFF